MQNANPVNVEINRERTTRILISSVIGIQSKVDGKRQFKTPASFKWNFDNFNISISNVFSCKLFWEETFNISRIMISKFAGYISYEHILWTNELLNTFNCNTNFEQVLCYFKNITLCYLHQILQTNQLAFRSSNNINTKIVMLTLCYAYFRHISCFLYIKYHFSQHSIFFSGWKKTHFFTNDWLQLSV